MIRFVCYNCDAVNEFEPKPDVFSYIVNCASCELSSLVQNKGADDWTVEPYNENSSEVAGGHYVTEVEDDYHGRVEEGMGMTLESESGMTGNSRDEITNSSRGGGNTGIKVD